MKRLLLAAAAAFCLFGSADAQTASQVIGSPNVSVSMAISSATTTKVISGSAVRATNITALWWVGAAGTVQFEYGNGTNCGSNTVTLTGAFTTAAQNYAIGNGVGSIFVIPAGNDFCIITTSTATVNGFVDYNQFVGSL